MRPSIDIYFQAIAGVVSTRSTCLRKQHGAALVRKGDVLSTGYNGACAGLPHCTDIKKCVREEKGAKPGEHYEWCVAIHAELNAIIRAARLGVSTHGATIYVTGPPCLMCARAIINAGIVEVVYQRDRRYDPAEPVALLREAGVKVREVWTEFTVR